MKKVLLATSFLVGTTGLAAAEVALSGSARMGVVYDSSLDAGAGASFFSSRVRIVFTASGETDGGLAFGASMRADQQGGNDNDAGLTGADAGPDGIFGTLDDILFVVDKDGDSNDESTVFISGAFGKLTMGDVSGAADELVGQTSGIGYGPNDGRHEIDFIGTDKTAAYYEYSAGGFTVGLGVGQVWDADDDADLNDTANIAVKYEMGDYSVAVGYETSDAEDLLSVLGSATFGATTVKAKIADGDLVDSAFSLSVDHTFGATTVTAVYTDFGDAGDTTVVGLGAAYDLGGGAEVVGGVIMEDTAGASETFADLGVKFSF